MNHLTAEQVDEAAAGGRSAQFEHHLHACAECQARVRVAKRLDGVLRRMPLDRAGPGLADTILTQIGIGPAPPLAWTLLKNLAPIIALTVVTGIAILVLRYFGVFQGSELQQSTAGVQSIYSQTTGHIAEGVKVFNGWMGKYFSFAFARTTYGLTAFIGCFLGAVALFDKYVLMPKLRKKA